MYKFEPDDRGGWASNQSVDTADFIFMHTLHATQPFMTNFKTLNCQNFNFQTFTHVAK